MPAGPLHGRQAVADQARPQIADNGFDFRQFGHGSPRPSISRLQL
jgi:hypothetical protein